MFFFTRFKKYVQRKLGISRLIAEHQSLAERQERLIAIQQETLKANLFHDTICDSEWLKNKGFSPGGWAVDYGLMYTLYRVLNDMKPMNVIEFGLGQSSKLLHQYGSFYSEAKVLTCEHNSDWVDFFKAEVNERYELNIKMLELQNRNYNGFETLVYNGVDEVCNGQKYNLIVVDGPYGSKHYSRSQLIDVAQNNLADHFCIIMDDYERIGEQDTITEVKRILNSKEIQYSVTVYAASKQHCLLCSKDLEFLTTLCWF